jgi:hypothetical protein
VKAIISKDYLKRFPFKSGRLTTVHVRPERIVRLQERDTIRIEIHTLTKNLNPRRLTQRKKYRQRQACSGLVSMGP